MVKKVFPQTSAQMNGRRIYPGNKVLTHVRIMQQPPALDPATTVNIADL